MPSTPPVPPADALLAALERYALHVAQLTVRWKDADLYNRVSQDVDAVRQASILRRQSTRDIRDCSSSSASPIPRHRCVPRRP